MEGRRRYRPRGDATRSPWWRAEVNAVPLDGERAPRPGPVTDADDERLAALRRRVVEPVVTGLLTPGEVEHLSVHRGVGGAGDDGAVGDGEVGDVWVRIDVPGERYEMMLLSPGWHALDDTGAATTRAEVAAHLADRLEDWVCETAFAWGQQRRARYELPEA